MKHKYKKQTHTHTHTAYEWSDDDEEAAVDGRAAGAIRQIIFSSDISISGGQLGRSSSIT